MSELAELDQVVFRDAELHRLEATGLLNRFSDFSDAIRRGIGNRENRRCVSFRFVDLLLLFAFRSLDRLLLFAFGAINRGVQIGRASCRERV